MAMFLLFFRRLFQVRLGRANGTAHDYSIGAFAAVVIQRRHSKLRSASHFHPRPLACEELAQMISMFSACSARPSWSFHRRRPHPSCCPETHRACRSRTPPVCHGAQDTPVSPQNNRRCSRFRQTADASVGWSHHQCRRAGCIAGRGSRNHQCSDPSIWISSPTQSRDAAAGDQASTAASLAAKAVKLSACLGSVGGNIIRRGWRAAAIYASARACPAD
jgi:hypothetical protein